jgi:hypothetical protein
MVVVDEFDQLKESKDKHVRWRAGYTLAVLERLFAKSTNPAQLHAPGALPAAPDGRMRGEVKVELLFDPPEHIRLQLTTTRSSTGRWPSSRWQLAKSPC